MPVCELLRRMPSSEFTEWMIVHQKIQPFGETRADLRAGMVASPLVNLQLSKDSRRTKPGDWILDLSPEPPTPQTPEQMKAIFKALAEAGKTQKTRLVQGTETKKTPTLCSVAPGAVRPRPAGKNPASAKESAPITAIRGRSGRRRSRKA